MERQCPNYPRMRLVDSLDAYAPVPYFRSSRSPPGLGAGGVNGYLSEQVGLTSLRQQLLQPLAHGFLFAPLEPL